MRLLKQGLGILSGVSVAGMWVIINLAWASTNLPNDDFWSWLLVFFSILGGVYLTWDYIFNRLGNKRCQQ